MSLYDGWTKKKKKNNKKTTKNPQIETKNKRVLNVNYKWTKEKELSESKNIDGFKKGADQEPIFGHSIINMSAIFSCIYHREIRRNKNI